MRVGLIARADRTGLASQTHAFWRNMAPAATLMVDLSRILGTRPDLSLYDDDPNITVWTVPGYPSLAPRPDPVLSAFLDQVDAVFTAETPYNWWLYQEARRRGVRVVLQPNYEFLDLTPGLPEPDVWALPTTWHMADIRRALPGRQVVHLPFPVDRELIPFRQRKELRTILHTAGTQAQPDRAGTRTLVEAMRRIKSPVKAVIRSQTAIAAPWSMAGDRIATKIGPVDHYWRLYDEGDLYVQPRRFGGLNLPMQEALAAGMPVLVSDVAPQSTMLPEALLVPARIAQKLVTRAPIEVYDVDPQALAERIDWLYEEPKAFAWFSAWGQRWAIRHDWEALKPAYEAVLRGDAICASCS